MQTLHDKCLHDNSDTKMEQRRVIQFYVKDKEENELEEIISRNLFNLSLFKVFKKRH